MKLTTLHARLAGLIDQGYGDHHVIDDRGNDVKKVVAPLIKECSRKEDAAVMLYLAIDDKGWNQ